MVDHADGMRAMISIHDRSTVLDSELREPLPSARSDGEGTVVTTTLQPAVGKHRVQDRSTESASNVRASFGPVGTQPHQWTCRLGEMERQSESTGGFGTAGIVQAPCSPCRLQPTITDADVHQRHTDAAREVVVAGARVPQCSPTPVAAQGAHRRLPCQSHDRLNHLGDVTIGKLRKPGTANLLDTDQSGLLQPSQVGADRSDPWSTGILPEAESEYAITSTPARAATARKDNSWHELAAATNSCSGFGRSASPRNATSALSSNW